MFNQTASTILKIIKAAHHPLLIAHEKPDGDTLGASLAMSHFLTNEQIKHKHFCIDKPADYFSFLPRIENIIYDVEKINLADHDLIITIDCGDPKRTGLSEQLAALKDQLVLINIDHHQTNQYFGQHNLVIPTASSTSEIIYKFFEYHKIELDKYMATSLLTGILTDTMNFTNAATTKESLKIASNLLNSGARITQITSSLTQNKSLLGLRLWGNILSRLEIEPQMNFAHTVITLEDLTKEKIDKDDLDGLANFLSLLQDAEFILLLTEEEDDVIKGSLRTTKDTHDMTEIAAIFGGGGHKKAAGFRVDKKSITQDSDWKNFILNAIIEKLKANNQTAKN